MIKEDARNIGGRKVIVDKMMNHHKALINAKTTLNLERRPASAVKKQKKASYKQLEEQAEVYTAFKKVAA